MSNKELMMMDLNKQWLVNIKNIKMSNKKEYILKTNGEIKECPSNISKMNLYKYIKTFTVFRRFFYNLIPEKEAIEHFVMTLFRLLIFVTLPISMIIIIVISSLSSIKKAKKEVNEWKKKK